MKTIVFFNNKGGVGKTTLCSNIASHFASAGLRTVLIDCDPQCNSTLLTLGDEFFEGSLENPNAESLTATIFDVIKPINDGSPDPNTEIVLAQPDSNRFNVAVLAGHPRLSLIEDKLSVAWASLLAGDIGGLRTSNWFNHLALSLRAQYDVALVDVGPSLGSLNRSVLIGADYFVTPMGCDIFSLIGIRNISDWLEDWVQLYESGFQLSIKRHPARDLKAEYKLVASPKIVHGFAGYTVQQYITKSKQGVRRATAAYEKILEKIDPEICQHLEPFFITGKRKFVSKLGDVPNMFSLIPLAQSVNSPINKLQAIDGLVGSQFKQASAYGQIIDGVARTLGRNTELFP